MNKGKNSDPWYLRYQVVLTILTIIIYWIIETLMDTFFLVGGSMRQNISPTNWNELWARFLVISTIIVGSWYAHKVKVKIKRMNEEIRISAEKIKYLAYYVLHDLGNLSVALSLSAKHLVKKHSGKLEGGGVQICSEILNLADRMRELTRQLEEIIETGEAHLRIKKIEVNEDILRIIKDEFTVRFKERKVIFVVSDEIPAIRGDLVFLTRLMRNLVDNALKHAKSLSRIEIDYMDEEDFHVLLIGDDGRGVKDSEKIFQMFERGESSEGMGLGLANVKEITQRHGGKVRVESSRKGTTFFVYLAKNL